MVPKPLLEDVLEGGDHEAEDVFVVIEHEGEAPKHFLKSDGGARCNLKLKISMRGFPLPLRW